MVRKKQIFVLSILLLIGVLSVFFLSQTVQNKNKKKEAYQSIPSFSLLDLQGNRITEKALKKNATTLFLFFDPECDLCYTELKEINANIDALNNCQMIFFSTLPVDSIRDFLENIAFHQTSNMFFLIDEKEELVNAMEIQGTPTSIIYDKNRHLLKRFAGPVKIETLIKYLSE